MAARPRSSSGSSSPSDDGTYPLTLVIRRQARLAATRAQTAAGPRGPAWLALDVTDFMRFLWTLRGGRPGGVRLALVQAHVTAIGDLQFGASPASADAAGGPTAVSFLVTVTMHPEPVAVDPGRCWP